MEPCESGKKVIKEMIEDEEIILIAGIINATGTLLYWKSDGEISVGDYAIVENKNGYDLIKSVGIIYTTKKEASKFSKTKYENMKKVIQGFKCEIIEK